MHFHSRKGMKIEVSLCRAVASNSGKLRVATVIKLPIMIKPADLALERNVYYFTTDIRYCRNATISLRESTSVSRFSVNPPSQKYTDHSSLMSSIS